MEPENKSDFIIEDKPFISSAQIDRIIPDLIKAQAAFPKIAFDVDVSYTNSRGKITNYSYASLSRIIESIRPQLNANGIYIMQAMKPDGDRTKIITSLIHSSGQFVSSEVSIVLSPDPQAAGSLITYFKRYTLSAIAGIQADSDDDGMDAKEAADSKPRQPLPSENKGKNLTQFSKDDFDKMLPKFNEAIQAGKRTPDQIIANLKTKYILSEEQILEIRRFEIEQEEKQYANN